MNDISLSSFNCEKQQNKQTSNHRTYEKYIEQSNTIENKENWNIDIVAHSLLKE